MAETFPEMDNPNAALAFAAYVAMGPDRSLDALATKYRNSTEAVPTRQLTRLKIWSTRYEWRKRLASSVNESVDQKIELAAEFDADSFLNFSRAINQRSKYATRDHADAIVKMRESVRKPAPKTPAESTIKHSGTVTHVHRDMSLFTDDEIASLAAVAERSKAERV